MWGHKKDVNAFAARAAGNFEAPLPPTRGPLAPTSIMTPEPAYIKDASERHLAIAAFLDDLQMLCEHHAEVLGVETVCFVAPNQIEGSQNRSSGIVGSFAGLAWAAARQMKRRFVDFELHVAQQGHVVGIEKTRQKQSEYVCRIRWHRCLVKCLRFSLTFQSRSPAALPWILGKT